MTAAIASPLYANTAPHKEVVLKKVKGQLLRREESYTEALVDGEEPAVKTPLEEEKEEEAMVMMMMNPSYNRHHHHHKEEQEDHINSPVVLEGERGEDCFMGPALKRNIRAWREATGLPTTITIRFKERVFHLHKFPLISRSGYLKRLLKDTKEVTLPSDCPGGPDIFELVANFCYGSTILMEPSNIAELRSVAEYLQMSEDYGRANLCERTDLYLTQEHRRSKNAVLEIQDEGRWVMKVFNFWELGFKVALQNWEDTLVVLSHCESIAPLAEQLHIVSRCIEALAFMACMELLDPAERKARSRMPGEAQFWNDFSMSEIDAVSPQWWVQDLVALPPNHFVKLIVALRREGMQEKYVGHIITCFSNQWIFGTEVDTIVAHKGRVKSWVLKSTAGTKPKLCIFVESVVRVLPLERNIVPVSFLFAVLRRGLACALKSECRIQLETRIALQLEQATVDDIFLRGKEEKENSCLLRSEVDSMERIVKLFFSWHQGLNDAGGKDMTRDPVPAFSKCIQKLSTVAKLWDDYLAEVSFESKLSPVKFADLIERVPAYARVTHDNMYKAIHSYLKAHPNTTQDDRLLVCRTLNCQKLSQDVCTHAVQNELMPLRMIVQAMFMQQLQTRTVLTSHLESVAHSFQADAMFAHGGRSLPNSSSPVRASSASESGHLQHSDYPRSQDSFLSNEYESACRADELRGDDSAVLVKRDLVDSHAVLSSSSSVSHAVGAKVNYHATESRLRSLEAELSQMRRVLSESMVDQEANLRRHSSSSSHTSRLASDKAWDSERHYNNSSGATPAVHSSRAGTMMPTVHEQQLVRKEHASGCMSQLKQANRTSGLFAKTLQKLKWGGSRKSKNSIKEIGNPVIVTPTDVKTSPGPTGSSFWWAGPQDGGRVDHSTATKANANRTDSMPRTVSNRSGHHHIRHNSMN